MDRIKEYLKFNWKMTPFIITGYAMLLGVIGLQLVLNLSLISELNNKTKKIFDLEKQIIGLKLSHPIETNNRDTNFQRKDDPEQEYFR